MYLFKCKFQSKINNKFLNNTIIHKSNKMKMIIRNYSDKSGVKEKIVNIINLRKFFYL